MSQHQDTYTQNPVVNQTEPDYRHRTQHPEREIDTPSLRSLPLSPPLLPFVYLSREYVGSDTVPFWSDSTGPTGPTRPELGPLVGQ